MTFIVWCIVLIVVAVAGLVVAARATDQGARVVGLIVGALATAVFLISFFWASLLIVPAGEVYVATLFGTVQEHEYSQGGPYLTNPLYSWDKMSVRRQIAEFQSGGSGNNNDDVVAVSKDNLPLTIDVTYAYQINPSEAWLLYRNIGKEDIVTEQLVKQAARSATRSATAIFNYDEATTSKRDGLATEMESQFKGRLIADLVRQGISKEVAEKAFTVLPVQLRKALPPARVQSAISEKIASEQDLQRQTILTNIAQQEALRRAQEGSGVSKLFENLPKNFTSGQIAEVMTALANKEKADAMLRAVESGKVSVMVMDGSTPSINTK